MSHIKCHVKYHMSCHTPPYMLHITCHVIGQRTNFLQDYFANPVVINSYQNIHRLNAAIGNKSPVKFQYDTRCCYLHVIN